MKKAGTAKKRKASKAKSSLRKPTVPRATVGVRFRRGKTLSIGRRSAASRTNVAIAVVGCVRDVLDRERPGWDAGGQGMVRLVKDLFFTRSSLLAALRLVDVALRNRSGYGVSIGPYLVLACLAGTVGQMTERIAAAVEPIPDGDSVPIARFDRRSRAETNTRRSGRPRARLATVVPAFPDDAFQLDVDPSESSQRRLRKSRGSQPRTPRPKAGTPSRSRARYGNVVVLDSETETLLRTIDPGQLVRLRIDIGHRSRVSQVRAAEPLPLPDLDRDVDVDIMVSSTDFGVSLLKNAERSSLAQARLRLPRESGAAVAPDGGRYLYFYLSMPKRLARSAHARISYYYKSVLLQSQKLTVMQGSEAPPSVDIVTDYTATLNFSALERIPKRPRLSILTNDNGGGQHQIIIRHPGATSDPAMARTFALNDDVLRQTIKQLRKVLAERAPSRKQIPARTFTEDLKALAPIGWQLYTQLPGQLPPDFYSDLQTKPESYVVQVGRPETSGFVLPWAYIYDIPLISDVNPTVCPMVEKWDGKRALFDGDLRQCPCGPHERDVICPFGFWGYRYAIEQLSSSDKPVLTIPAAPKCDVVVGETQYEVDLAKLDAHVGRLRTLLAATPAQAQLREGKDKVSLELLLGADIPFVYFYCHGERANIADPNTYLGIGKAERITAQDLIGWTQTWYTRLKKLIWNAVRPLVFINACHSLAIEPETLVSYLQAFVSRGRAAGVVGTEVKVDQVLAMDVAEQFVAAWMSGQKTVEEALRAVRMDYLRTGNLLGLTYTPYSWSELKIVGPQ